jgi:FKBP-type peptidyl-prolyl cis-trans isomerase SlyD
VQISDKTVVDIHYSLKDKQGELLDSSEGRSPLAYIQGIGNIIPGLEKALEGKTAGDKIQAVIQPEDAYGVRDEQLVWTVPKSNFQEQSEVRINAQFRVETDQGMRVATVTGVEGDNVTVDLNHPLAGEELHFDVEVINVREATKEELSHGHVHHGDDH